MLADLNEVLGAAKEGKYSVGAFNIVNALCITPLIRAAEAKRSPLIMMVAEMHYKASDVVRIAPGIVEAAKNASVPVVVYLDHGITDESVIFALRNGFNALMYDASKQSYEDNISKTRMFADFAHSVGVSVEGELGHVCGHEASAGVAVTSANSAFTNIEMVADYVERSGVDALAVSVGNVHGFYKGEPELQFELIEKIAAVSKVPLVLHGASGISDADFRHAAECGITKFNYYTGMSAAVFKDLDGYFRDLKGKYVDLTSITCRMMDAIQQEVEQKMEIFGSVGKA